MTNEEAVKIFEERLAFGEKEYSDVAKDYIEAIKTAISALRAQEKEPCECGCDVCNRNFSGNGLMRVREGTYLVLREIRDIVDAKYCPMCGRPLKGENEK